MDENKISKMLNDQENRIKAEFKEMLVKSTTDLANFIVQKNYQEYLQVEALFSIHSVLDLRYPLPPMRGWPISPDFGNLVITQILERSNSPEFLFELGSGVSTVLSAYCFEKLGHGRIFSLDHDEKFSRESLSMLNNHGLKDLAEIIYTPLTPTVIGGNKYQWYDISQIEEIPQIDILVIDGPPAYQQKMARFPALPKLYKYLKPGAVILVDDANRPDEVEMVKLWLNEFPDLSAQEVKTEKGAVVIKKKIS